MESPCRVHLRLFFLLFLEKKGAITHSLKALADMSQRWLIVVNHLCCTSKIWCAAQAVLRHFNQVETDSLYLINSRMLCWRKPILRIFGFQNWKSFLCNVGIKKWTNIYKHFISLPKSRPTRGFSLHAAVVTAFCEVQYFLLQQNTLLTWCCHFSGMMFVFLQALIFVS